MHACYSDHLPAAAAAAATAANSKQAVSAPGLLLLLGLIKYRGDARRAGEERPAERDANNSQNNAGNAS